MVINVLDESCADGYFGEQSMPQSSLSNLPAMRSGYLLSMCFYESLCRSNIVRLVRPVLLVASNDRA